MAALEIQNGMTVPEFFLHTADYVLRNHRKLKRHRVVFRRGVREILSAVEAPSKLTDKVALAQERDRRRREALDRFSASAGAALREPG
jgi:hypothetical protein